VSRQGSFEDERGFTLVEVLTTIILMGILLAIAFPVLFGVVEGRRVDSATNQLAADLRLAHTRATNRLEQWQVVLDADSSTYTIGPVGAPSTRDLDDDPAGDEVVVATEDDADAAITFEADGSAVLPGDASPVTLIVRSADDETLSHVIEINAATSRIQIDP
jgi:prepilin-type N-terminal cleavage/methylation domain-containing protein